ncbi:hypothetical protein BaRGS_00025012 [Batillaria attramentaria]|uniref:Pre-mRNA-splicing factor CWC25 n=1 Tax=Batillaria attramentaria TaxID=370345 RepID=A0ABD0K9K9_9CAEN
MDKVDADEKKKMFDLMKDRELGGNMDWMYRGHKIDTEDYLLGKSVDKMITGEPTATEESTVMFLLRLDLFLISSKILSGGVGSLISERIKANVALDMQAKMREDPLFAIRRKEEDARKRLLENPVKMKQLQKLVEQQQRTKKQKSGGSGDTRDAKQHHGSKQKTGGEKHSDWTHSRDRESSRAQSRDVRDERRARRFSGDRDRSRPRNVDRRRQSPSPSRERRKRKDSSEDSENEDRHIHTSRRGDSSDEEVSKRVYGLIARSPPRRQRSRSPAKRKRSRTPPVKRRSRSPPKNKLTAEEREKKLQEMMDNAKWREEQRTKNVQRYKQEEDREAGQLTSRSKANFLSSMMAEHASSSSVEDRLKRNKYNIQRTRAALDKNFTKQ